METFKIPKKINYNLVTTAVNKTGSISLKIINLNKIYVTVTQAVAVIVIQYCKQWLKYIFILFYCRKSTNIVEICILHLYRENLFGETIEQTPVLQYMTL